MTFQSTGILPYDGILQYAGFCTEKKDTLLSRLTAVAQACLWLVVAILQQSVRAVVRLVMFKPIEAARELVSLVVQSVALPLLGFGMMLRPNMTVHFLEWFNLHHRVVDLSDDRAPKRSCVGHIVCHFLGGPVCLVGFPLLYLLIFMGRQPENLGDAPDCSLKELSLHIDYFFSPEDLNTYPGWLTSFDKTLSSAPGSRTWIQRLNPSVGEGF